MRTIDEIVCPICGFRNSIEQERCISCGAQVEVLAFDASQDERQARRYQQEDFEWKWALIGAALFTALQSFVLGLLPLLIEPFDPMGLAGLMLSVPLFLVGGVALGILSPGKTFLEPAVGAMFASLPTLTVVSLRTPEGFEPSLLAYIVSTAMGVLVALFGALGGEWVQMTAARSAYRHSRAPARRS